MKYPIKTIERLLLYRTILTRLSGEGQVYIHSSELAEYANNNAAQVRSDFRSVNYTGMPVNGYEIAKLINKIMHALKLKKEIKTALIGVGRLGSAVMSYFRLNKTRFTMVAAFDKDSTKVSSLSNTCPIYLLDELRTIIEKEGITYILLCVPASAAQEITDTLSELPIKGILNFTSIPLKVRKGINVNRVDITLQMEKLAFYSH